MEISAINSVRPAYGYSVLKKKNPISGDNSVSFNNIKVLSFKAGNPNHVLHICGEMKPFATSGGVATVVEDYKVHNVASATESGKKTFVAPYYNGKVTYDKSGNKKGVQICRVPHNLPEGHPLKGKEGQPIQINVDLSENTIEDVVLSKKNYVLLEEVESKTMTWGLEEKAPIKLLKVVADSNNKPIKDDIYVIFSEATAYAPAPYADGSYSSETKKLVNSWQGDPYAKFDKAVVEFMDTICKKSDINPGTFCLSDSQAAWFQHFAAQRNLAGDENFKNIKCQQVGHNLGDGYIGKTSPRNMLVDLDLLSPDEIKAMLKSPEYQEALAGGEYSENRYFQRFFKGMKANDKFSAMGVAVHYTNAGFTQMNTVSEGYAKSVVSNNEVAPSLYKDLKALSEKGLFYGITNVLRSGKTPFDENIGLPAYSNPFQVKLKSGEEVVLEPFKMLPKDVKGLSTEELYNLIQKTKLENQINFIERFLPKFDGAQYLDKAQGKYLPNGDAAIRAGMTGKGNEVLYTIDQKYVDLLKKNLETIKQGKEIAPADSVEVLTSWGRMDFQKGFDEVMMTFQKFVDKHPEKNILLILGGDMSNSPEEANRVKNLAKLFSKDPKYKGKIILMDGFAPGNPMGWMADLPMFLSRFAPCELTDYEVQKLLTPALVTNCQGLGQKNFDIDDKDPKLAEKANGYKTVHEYYTPRDEIIKTLKEMNEQDNETLKTFEKSWNSAVKTIKTRYKYALNKEIKQEEIDKILLGETPPFDKVIGDKVKSYQNALRDLRDELISIEATGRLDKIYSLTKEDRIKMLDNLRKTTFNWEDNQSAANTEISSGQKYREAFHRPAPEINKTDIIGYGVDKPKLDTKPKAEPTFAQKIRAFANKPEGRWAIGTVAAAALIGVGCAFAHRKDPKDEKVSDNLALIG